MRIDPSDSDDLELVRLAARQWGILDVRLVAADGGEATFVVSTSPTVCEEGAERFAEELADAFGTAVVAYDAAEVPAALAGTPSTRVL